MHEKYGKDGLVVMSVSIDRSENKDAALRFLKKQQATFPNYLLAEDEDWQEFFGGNVQPLQVVYNRAGKSEKIFEGGGEEVHQELVTVIEKLLRAGK